MLVGRVGRPHGLTGAFVVEGPSVDPERLLRLLLSHRAMLLGYIIARVRQIDLAEDIFQDVAVVILSKGARLNEEAGFAPWARKIARLEALARLRKRRKSPRSLDQAVLDVEDLTKVGANILFQPDKCGPVSVAAGRAVTAGGPPVLYITDYAGFLYTLTPQ